MGQWLRPNFYRVPLGQVPSKLLHPNKGGYRALKRIKNIVFLHNLSTFLRYIKGRACNTMPRMSHMHNKSKEGILHVCVHGTCMCEILTHLNSGCFQEGGTEGLMIWNFPIKSMYFELFFCINVKLGKYNSLLCIICAHHTSNSKWCTLLVTLASEL